MPSRRPPKVKLSPIDQAILNAQGEVAEIRAEMGNAVADAVVSMIGMQKDIEITGPLTSYRRHIRESLVANLVDFADVAPTDVEAVRRAQNAIREYRTLLEWMATTFEIGTGEIAHMESMSGDDDEPRDD
tara:strand:+ start:266 stop:655 length:390 start_codon:yes stop_codon:yes gene_type:complete